AARVQEGAAARREQATGIGQLNKGMTHVDKVTQRNAAAAEELASTAEELASQAASQRDLVAFFKVDGGVVEAAAPAPPPPGPAEPATVAAPPANGSGPERTSDADFRPFCAGAHLSAARLLPRRRGVRGAARPRGRGRARRKRDARAGGARAAARGRGRPGCSGGGRGPAPQVRRRGGGERAAPEPG